MSSLLLRSTIRIWLLTALLLVAGSQGVRGDEPSPFQPFDVALLGDPQIGYGRGAEYQDAERFRKVVTHINENKIPLSIIAGDLVENRSPWQTWAFNGVLEHLEGKVLLIAGNHDVVDEDSLRDFRRRYGRDYYDVVVNNTAFLILNSETARDLSLSPSEYEKQWAFLEQTLATHHALKRNHIVLVMHRPPFEEHEDEPDARTNWPLTTRKRLLSLAREYGVHWIFAGHLHRTVHVKTKDGIHVLVSAGTSRSFDRSPVAYYRIHVTADQLSPDLVVVDAPPPEPFSVPGLRDWTPRIFDFSIRHWLFTLLYAITGLVAWSSGRRHENSASHEARLWRLMAIALFFFSVNMQLDFDELVRELGRVLAKVTGVFALRHVITGSVALAGSLAAAFYLSRLYTRSRRERPATIALSLLAIPTAWFGLSMISHHSIGMIFDEMTWDVLILGALAGIAVSARVSARAASTSA